MLFPLNTNWVVCVCVGASELAFYQQDRGLIMIAGSLFEIWPKYIQLKEETKYTYKESN